MVLNDILSASFGEAKNNIRVSFKKTVLIRDYETEVIEGSCEVEVANEVSGAERVLMLAVAQAQMEYEAYVNLLMKGLVTQQAFDNRIKCLVSEVGAIKAKAEACTGKSMDKYFTSEMDLEARKIAVSED